MPGALAPRPCRGGHAREPEGPVRCEAVVDLAEIRGCRRLRTEEGEGGGGNRSGRRGGASLHATSCARAAAQTANAPGDPLHSRLRWILKSKGQSDRLKHLRTRCDLPPSPDPFFQTDSARTGRVLSRPAPPRPFRDSPPRLYDWLGDPPSVRLPRCLILDGQEGDQGASHLLEGLHAQRLTWVGFFGCFVS